MKLFTLILLICLVYPFTAAAQDFPDLPDWVSQGEMLTFNRENLWEHINGAADQFLDLGFQLLQVRDFNKDSVSISIELYDMGKELNAFGIYALERSAPFYPLQIGTQSILYLPAQALLLKNIFYVKIYAYEGELTKKSGKEILSFIAKNLPGNSGFPAELRALPKKNKLDGSEGYVREAFLGLNELKNCLFVEYEEEGNRRFKFFRMVSNSPAADKEIFDNLPEKWVNKKFNNYPMRFIEIPYSGTTAIILLKQGLLGVTDCKNENDIQQRLKILTSSE
jgi:hypothetical protein